MRETTCVRSFFLPSPLLNPSTASAPFVWRDLETSKSSQARGAIVQFVYRNPHSFVHVDAPDDHGVSQRWAVEWGGTSQLAQAGVKRDSLKVGDKVVINGRPSRVPGSTRPDGESDASGGLASTGAATPTKSSTVVLGPFVLGSWSVLVLGLEQRCFHRERTRTGDEGRTTDHGPWTKNGPRTKHQDTKDDSSWNHEKPSSSHRAPSIGVFRLARRSTGRPRRTAGLTLSPKQAAPIDLTGW